MTRGKRARTLVLWILGFSVLFSQDIFPTTLPNSTVAMLKKLKLDPSTLANIDAELKLPKEWIEKAKKEGKVRILSTASTVNPREMKMFYAPFKERYPFVAIEQSGASRRVRTVKTLLAYKNGRFTTDVITNIGGSFISFKEANALEDLRSIPAFTNVPEQAKDPDGLWVGAGTRYKCMAYNTKLVSRDALPSEWDNLLTDSRWHGGNLALSNRPNQWVLHLWKAKGENWAKEFMTRLFTEVKPQLRKEGMNASLELLAAGEFHAVIPALSNLVKQKVLIGAPLGFFCPEPMPVDTGDIAILKGAPNTYAARIFINWLLSSEGQISQYFARNVPPVHKGLMREELMPFAKQVLGKKVSFGDPGLDVTVLPELYTFWNKLWLKGGGRPRRR